MLRANKEKSFFSVLFHFQFLPYHLFLFFHSKTEQSRHSKEVLVTYALPTPYTPAHTIASHPSPSLLIYFSNMLTLESQCMPVVGGGVLILKTLPNQ